jgi:hypothetical protein
MLKKKKYKAKNFEKSREYRGKAHNFFTVMLTDFYFFGCARFITVSTIFDSHQRLFSIFTFLDVHFL